MKPPLLWFKWSLGAVSHAWLACPLLIIMALAAGAQVETSPSSTAQDPLLDVDTAWTAPEGTPTEADSLPAFRPDSLKDEVIRSAESAPSFLGRSLPKDSADSVAALLRGRRPSLSLWVGLDFADLDAKEVFEASLNARARRDSLTTLQPYEPVHLIIPVGLQAIWPAGPWFDLLVRTRSFWYQQTASLGKGGIPAGEEFFAVQAHLAGAGLRYYIPPALLSVTGKLGLYVQGAYYWLLAGEIYTHLGDAPADFEPGGSAWEIQLGFNQPVTRSLGITGNLGYISQGYSSDRPWGDLVAENPPAGKVDWRMAAIQASFNLAWRFGVEKAPAPVPAGPAGPRPAK